MPLAMLMNKMNIWGIHRLTGTIPGFFMQNGSANTVYCIVKDFAGLRSRRHTISSCLAVSAQHDASSKGAYCAETQPKACFSWALAYPMQHVSLV